jgi:hypothetical protein
MRKHVFQYSFALIGWLGGLVVAFVLYEQYHWSLGQAACAWLFGGLITTLYLEKVTRRTI